MLYPVTLYYGTGFDALNRPSTPAVLENATKRNFDSVWLLQDRGTASIKLKADWADVKDADYCKIGNSYYIVESIKQLNGVSQLYLSFDALNSAGGVSSFNIIDGWVIRASHKSNEFMNNTTPVTIKPTQPLVIDGPVAMGESNDFATQYTLIGATVDIEDTPTTAKTYIDASDITKSVTVPDIPAPTEETIFSMFGTRPDGVTPPSSWGTKKEQKAPNMTIFSLYDGNGKMIQSMSEAIQYIRALGLEDVITASYIIPFYYASVLQHVVDAKIPRIDAILHKYAPTDIPYRYGTYVPKNNRVYACSNVYTIMSIASGEKASFEAQELYSGGNEPDFYIYADPSPTGKPYCQPTYYRGRTAMLFENAIGGCQWLTTPITLTKQSGWLTTAAQNTFNEQNETIQANRLLLDTIWKYGEDMNIQPENTIDGYNKLIDGVGGVVNDTVRGLNAMQDLAVNQAHRRFNAMSSMKMVTPDIRFGRSTEMQGYVGNGFLVYRTRLSDIDMERLDNEFTMYGEPDNRKLEDNDLTSHKHFNYVEATNVSIKSASGYSIPLSMRNAIETIFTGGVRLWHELPNKAAMSNNPLKTNP